MSNKEHLPLLSKHRIIEHFHSSQAISILSQFSQIQSLSHGIVYTPSSKAKRETLSSTDQDHLSSLQTSKSTKAYGHSPLHGMSLEILGQVWSVEPTFPIINEAKKACATAAVEFFTAKNVAFFCTAHINYLSIFNSLLQIVGSAIPAPKFTFTSVNVSGNPASSICECLYIGKTYKSNPHPKKAAAKDEVCKLAFQGACNEPEVCNVLAASGKIPLQSLSDNVTVCHSTLDNNAEFEAFLANATKTLFVLDTDADPDIIPASSLPATPTSGGAGKRKNVNDKASTAESAKKRTPCLPKKTSNQDKLRILYSMDKSLGLPFYNYRNTGEVSGFKAQLIMADRVQVSDISHASRMDAAEDVAGKMLENIEALFIVEDFAAIFKEQHEPAADTNAGAEVKDVLMEIDGDEKRRLEAAEKKGKIMEERDCDSVLQDKRRFYGSLSSSGSAPVDAAVPVLEVKSDLMSFSTTVAAPSSLSTQRDFPIRAPAAQTGVFSSTAVAPPALGMNNFSLPHSTPQSHHDHQTGANIRSTTLIRPKPVYDPRGDSRLWNDNRGGAASATLSNTSSPVSQDLDLSDQPPRPTNSFTAGCPTYHDLVKKLCLAQNIPLPTYFHISGPNGGYLCVASVFVRSGGASSTMKMETMTCLREHDDRGEAVEDVMHDLYILLRSFSSSTV